SDHLGVPRDALAVTGGLLVARVDRHGKGLDERRPQTPLFRDELRVLDRDGRRRAERAQRLLVVGGELPASVLVDHLEHADDAVVLSGHREREKALRAVAGALVGFGVEARILVGVGDVDRLAGGRDEAGDAHTDGLPDLAGASAEGDPRPDLASLAVHDEDRGAIRVEKLCRHGRHVAKQGVQVGDRHEPAGHVEDQIELRSRGHFAIGPAARLAATIALVSALVRHQLSMGMCSSTGPTVSAICSSSIWSRRSNAPFLLLSAWMTPTTLWPSLPQTGTTSMFNVRNPVRRSTLRSKRASAYASGTLIVSPVSADCPARPWPIGSRISVAVRWATRAQSSFFFPLTM